MSYDFVTNIQHCPVIIAEMVNNDFTLLYYSHIPTAIIALIMGFFVFIKNKKNLLSKILFAISITFSLWLIFDLILWKTADSRMVMFFWSLLGILDITFFMLSFYFIYVFIKKKDLNFKLKILLVIFILPVVFLTPTRYNLSNFIFEDCEGLENEVLLNYIFGLEIFLVFLIILFSAIEYKKSDVQLKRQMLILLAGVLFYLMSFFGAGYIAIILDNYKYEFYGLFGITVFIGILTYLIVKYKAFNIKLLGAQALVAGIFILIGAQFFFIRNPINRILTSITLILTGIFGWWLIKSVKDEIRQKEEMADMTRRLALANQKLKRLDEAKTEFLSIASHQLRAPLTAIKGFSSMLLEGSYGEMQESVRGVVKKIEDANNRLAQLTENLLNISRIESGRLAFDFTESNIEESVKTVIEELEPNAVKKGLYVKYSGPASPITNFYFDKSKMHEVFMNILDNAIKYTPQGGIDIKVENLADTVRITFSDTGIGIPEDELSSISTKFHRADNARKTHADGSGIGMYVVSKILQAHNAGFKISSPGVGKGSTFTVELDKKFKPGELE